MSVKIFNIKITICYKTNLKCIQYNVNGLCVSLRLSQYSDTIWQYIFRYYMALWYQILYDITALDTIWQYSFEYYRILKKRRLTLSNTVGDSLPVSLRLSKNSD